MREILIKGGTGEAFPVDKDEFIKIIDVQGKQVADLIAINHHNPTEYLSTAHTRAMNGKLSISENDRLYSNFRNPMLLLLEDKVGRHDTLYPCCDPMRYSLDFGVEEHRNCRENFAQALKPYKIDYWRIPDPVNLFQNAPILPDGTFGEISEPESKPGDYVIFRALTDLVVAVSACPMDLTPLCGWKITDIKVEVYS